MASGRWKEAERYVEEACELFRMLGNRAMETDCLCLMATAQINCGRPRDGINTARAAHAISLEIQNAWGQVNSAIPLAQGLMDIGAYSEALVYAKQGADLTRTAGMFILLGSILTTLGAVHRAMLELDAARAVHLEAINKVEPSGLQPFIEMIATELCTDYALTRAWEEAYAYAQKVLSARSNVFLFSTQLTLWHRTEALVRAGDIERATEDVQHYGECIGNSRRYRIPYLRSLAVLAQYHGETGVAIEHLQEAAILAEEIGLPGELWLIEAAQGELYLRQGEQKRAHRAFGQAAATVQKLADNISDDGQRANFLAAAQVRSVLESVNRREWLE